MNGFEDVFNRLADLDWGWWPFLGLRPAKDEAMSSRHVAKMALLFGLFYGPSLIVLLALAGVAFGWGWIVAAMLTSVLGFFLVYRFTFALAWNQRARWLSARRRH